MNEFEIEVRERRNLCRSAGRRVCGAKSRRCSLPSDRMTQAQWKRKNGPVATVRLGQPMTWADYEKLDDGLRWCWLEDLMKAGLDGQSIADMLGVDRDRAVAEVCRLKLARRKERSNGRI